MAKDAKKSIGSKGGKRNGKAMAKPKKPNLLRYEELLERMKSLNLPPTDIVADEKRLRALEGF